MYSSRFKGMVHLAPFLLSIELLVTGCVSASSNSIHVDVWGPAVHNEGSSYIILEREQVKLTASPFRHGIIRDVEKRDAVVIKVLNDSLFQTASAVKVERRDTTNWTARDITGGKPSYALLGADNVGLYNLAGEAFQSLRKSCAPFDEFATFNGAIVFECNGVLSELSEVKGDITSIYELDSIWGSHNRDSNVASTESSRRSFLKNHKFIGNNRGSLVFQSRPSEIKSVSNSDAGNNVIIINKESKKIKVQTLSLLENESLLYFNDRDGGWAFIAVNGVGYPNKFKIDHLKIINIDDNRIYESPAAREGAVTVFVPELGAIISLEISTSTGKLTQTVYHYSRSKKLVFEFNVDDILSSKHDMTIHGEKRLEEVF